MKAKTLGILTAASIMFGIGNANANILFDIYMGGTYGIGGYSLYDGDDYTSKSSQSYGAVLGMDIPMFRIELEYNYLDTDELKLNTGFVNGYFKLPTPVLSPYIGAGIGMNFSSKYEPKYLSSIDLDDNILYQGMLGATLNIPVLPFKVDVEGRVIYADKLLEYANQDIDLIQYEGRIKLRYIF